MARIAEKPIIVPESVELSINQHSIKAKGSKGELTHLLADSVSLTNTEGELSFSAKNNSKAAKAIAGTTRSVVNNMIHGVTEGFQIKLKLVGVGYRVKASDKSLNLTLGLSHPVKYQAPEGISFEAPSATEIVIKGCDKQSVGQVAAELRELRKPEPYKGKGIRHFNEIVKLKETKKK